jgi:hypothetical protein
MTTGSPVASSSSVVATDPSTEFSSGTTAPTAADGVQHVRHRRVGHQLGVLGDVERAQCRFAERAFRPEVAVTVSH